MQYFKFRSRLIILLISIGILTFGLSFPTFIKAELGAKLYFLPVSGKFEVGQSIQVRVAVDTGGQAINAVEDTISFSKDTLECVNLSKSKSDTILTLWIKEPACSAGQITFAGGVPDPGFTGTGCLFIINFKAKATGDAWVKFNQAQVLANDGLGTNILSSSGRADFEITSRKLPEPSPVEALIIPPVGIKIYSPTHPDQNQWSSKRDVVFTWTWQQGITDFSYIFDKNPRTEPDKIGEGLITSISYLNVEDGIWYFHLAAKTGTKWGPTSHYKVQIDTTKPYGLKIIPGEKLPTVNPSPLIEIEAKDDASGIDYYQIRVDQEEAVKTDKNKYQLFALKPGKHQVEVLVFDKSGNYLDNRIDLEILPLPVPKIDFWTEQILLGEPFVVRGKSVANIKVNLNIFDEKNKLLSLNTQSDNLGNWLIEYTEVLAKGKYRFYAVAETATDVISSPSEEKTFEILTNAIKIFGIIFPANAIIWLIISLLAIIGILVALFLFFYLPFFPKMRGGLKRFLKKRTPKIIK